jgi:hypothetical protein
MSGPGAGRPGGDACRQPQSAPPVLTLAICERARVLAHEL